MRKKQERINKTIEAENIRTTQLFNSLKENKFVLEENVCELPDFLSPLEPNTSIGEKPQLKRQSKTVPGTNPVMTINQNTDSLEQSSELGFFSSNNMPKLERLPAVAPQENGMSGLKR